MGKKRVQKIIAQAGVCSRRKAEELILERKVKVNNKFIKLGDKADLHKDKITVNGKNLFAKKKRYIIFNKPSGIVTTLYDPEGRRNIKHFLRGINERLFPAGRLDYDAEGLLILTNDGDFANRIMHPRYKKIKIYIADLDKKITYKTLVKLKRKIKLKDGLVKIENYRRINNTKIKIGIHEGRKHIVKRIFAFLGFKVMHLKRIQIGNVKLGNLKHGELRKMSESEILGIFR